MSVIQTILVAIHPGNGHRCLDPESLPTVTSDTSLSSMNGFFRRPPRHPSILRIHQIPSRYYDVRRTLVQGTFFNCSNGDNVDAVFTSPTCPANTIMNYDENRMPNVLVETVCGCTKCIGRADVAYRNGNFRSCALITEYIMVYRRVRCVYGRFVYDRVWEPVKVGCPCSIRRWRMGADPILTPKSAS